MGVVSRGLVVLCIAIALLPARAVAQGLELPTPSGFVNDFAGVVDPASRKSMETMARNFRDRAQIDVAVVTLPSLGGRPIEEVGLRIGREWKIGAGQEKDGVAILLAVEERRSRIEVSRHLEDEIPDMVASRILRGSREAFAAGRHGEGLTLALETLLATIAEKKGISIDGIDASRAYRAPVEPQPRSRVSRGSCSPLLVIAVIFILFVIIGGGGGRGGRRFGRRGGFIPFPIIIPGGRGGGGGGGGGSWGGGGGDSWGGFGGGGDFGGGGASDSW